MKKRLMILLLLWFGVSALSAAELVILYTSDTHAHFQNSGGGWLKLAPLIRQEFNDPANMLLIDCGDTLQGTLEGAYDKGAAVIRTMNALKFDVWVIGNHDTEFGFPALRTRTSEFAGAVLAGNLVFPGGKKELASWKMFERAGLKIAVIGMTLPNMHDDVRFADHIRGYSGGIIEDISGIMPEIRAAKPDLVVLAMHAPQRAADFAVFDVVKSFPEISLILGAHSHKAVAGEKIGGAWYAQVGCHARELGKVTVEYDTAKRRVNRVSSVLLNVPEDIAPDPELSEILTDYLRQTREFGEQVVAHTTSLITGPVPENMLNAPVGMLMASAMRRSTGADLALLSVNTRTGLKGAIREYDLFQVMPYENTVAVLTVNASELREILNEQLSNNRSYYASIFQGLKVTYRKKQVTGIYDAQMRQVPDETVFKLAAANYLLISNRFPVLRKIASARKLEKLPADPLMRDCIRDYIRLNSPLEPSNEQWMISER